LLDPSKVNFTLRHTNSPSKIISAGKIDAYGSFTLKVNPGDTYLIHSLGTNYGGYYDKNFTLTEGYTAIENITFTTVNGNAIFTVPDNNEIAYANLLVAKLYDEDTDTYSIKNPEAMIQKGSVYTGYEPYNYTTLDNITATDAMKDIINDAVEIPEFLQAPITPDQTSFFEQATQKNLFNPANITWRSRYSGTTTAAIVPDETVSTENTYIGFWVEVEENETYMCNGISFAYGGYYSDISPIGTHSIAEVTFINPVQGAGKYFIVPSGLDIHYVALLLQIPKQEKIDMQLSAETLTKVQVELGEIATDIIPYDANAALKIPLKYLDIDSSLGTNSSNSKTYSDKIKELDPVQFTKQDYDKCSNFFTHYLAKDKDLVIVNSGTSLTARSTEHSTAHPNAKFRPPCCDSNNFFSLMWDTIMWEGQEYRRYDSGYFTESGGIFISSYSLSEWDDGSYRRGWTRYINDTNANIQFVIPEEAFQFNFIYRTDTVGDENVVLTISEGNNKVEVFNGESWVEANGFIFSMKETIKYLENIRYPSPTNHNELSNNVERYQISGNTTYQKRLKMRCKSNSINSIGTIKNIIITSSGVGRFMYWGVEWSPREYMVTYINSARGSHGYSITDHIKTTEANHGGLHRYIDNEIISYKPDLIFSENAIHNSGGSGPSSTYFDDYFGLVAYDFFMNKDCPVSIISRAIANGINEEDIDFITFTSTITWNFKGIYGRNDDETDQSKIGLLKFLPTKDGTYCTGLDLQTMSNNYLSKYCKGLHINACQYFCDGAVSIYGNMKDATIGSGQNGDTLTNEGSHWNDNGSLLMFNCMKNLFNIYK